MSDLGRLRARHRAGLLAGRVQVSRLWGRDCLAYNVIVRPVARACSDLRAVAQQLADHEPQLLCVPEDALHISVAWLLAVHRRYPVAKDSLWARRGEEWMEGLRQIARSFDQFEICYESLVATDSAIIAVAEPSEPVNELRRAISTELDLPAESDNDATLVHTTLCRYLGPFSNPGSLVDHVDRCSLAVPSRVAAVEVCKELVYPSLKTECVARLALASI